MFYRSLLGELRKWAQKTDRKPLIIRGARQVGKTTVINAFAADYEQYIYLNLELPEDRQLFRDFRDINLLVQAIFFTKNKVLGNQASTLIFIDEIQEVPEALNVLRYFYEDIPEIAVVAAGSMLESLFDRDIHFPVGRVEYKVLRPASFVEFLNAMNETAAIAQLEKIPFNSFAHNKLLDLFHTYALIGGMPEIVKHYAEKKDITALSPIYDSLITSYLDDVEKYSKNDTQVNHIRHAIRSSFAEAGRRIKFEGFGNSNYRSREIGEALRTLEKALLIYLVYPITAANLPLIPDLKKAPRLQILDTGMLNYFVGIQKQVLGTKDLSSVYQGILIEHLVGQELLASKFESLSSLSFWVRQKKGSVAELDFVYLFEGQLIPIEVKSGSEGTLRSLHLFMDMAPHNLAVRFYSGEVSITNSLTPSGKKYFLLNLPYYLVSEIEEYLNWFRQEVMS